MRLRKPANTYKKNRGHSGLYIPQCKLLSKENSNPLLRLDINGLNTFDTNTAENAVNIGTLRSEITLLDTEGT
jgi:hypothetical protein